MRDFLRYARIVLLLAASAFAESAVLPKGIGKIAEGDHPDISLALQLFAPCLAEGKLEAKSVVYVPEAARGAPASLRLADGTVLNAAAAVDGDYRTHVKGNGGKDWPVDLVVDLGRPHDLAAFQCSWYTCKGSEGYYAYTVDASDDGTAWSTVLDRSDRDDPTVAKTYGFTYARLSERARFVRLHVLRAYLHNNPACWYTPSFPDFKVFATPVQTP